MTCGRVRAFAGSCGTTRLSPSSKRAPRSRRASGCSRTSVPAYGAHGWPIRPGSPGFSGLWPFRDPPELELLYGVAEPLWGRGYAVEIAEAVLRHCFHTLDMPVVRASTDAANTASIRVMGKLGFSVVRRATVDGLDTIFAELHP